MVSGITYNTDFADQNSINNPLVGSNVQMQFGGFWSKSPTGNGIVKTKNSRASIYCNDASQLFSLDSGYVSMTLSFPFAIRDGIYLPLKDDTSTLNEYMLWGVNVGQYEVAQPSLYAALTPRGIEFTVFTSEGIQTLRDTVSNIDANTDVFFEFVWSSSEIDDYYVTLAIRIDNQDVDVGNAPISSESLGGLNFYVLNTPFAYSNMECTIRDLATWNRTPDSLIDTWLSSSESSSSESSSSSSSP